MIYVLTFGFGFVLGSLAVIVRIHASVLRIRSEARRAIRNAELAFEQRDRAIDFAADLAEAVDRAGGPMAVVPPRTTGENFRRNGTRLKVVE